MKTKSRKIPEGSSIFSVKLGANALCAVFDNENVFCFANWIIFSISGQTRPYRCTTTIALVFSVVSRSTQLVLSSNIRINIGQTSFAPALAKPNALAQYVCAGKITS